MESINISLRIVVVVPLGCNHSTPALCGALSPQCSLVVVCVADVGCTDDGTDGNDAVCSAGTAAGGATVSETDDGFASSALTLSLFSERRVFHTIFVCVGFKGTSTVPLKP